MHVAGIVVGVRTLFEKSNQISITFFSLFCEPLVNINWQLLQLSLKFRFVFQQVLANQQEELQVTHRRQYQLVADNDHAVTKKKHCCLLF